MWTAQFIVFYSLHWQWILIETIVMCLVKSFDTIAVVGFIDGDVAIHFLFVVVVELLCLIL